MQNGNQSKLEVCAASRCSTYKTLQDEAVRDFEQKMARISNLFVTDRRKWNSLSNQYIEEKNKKLHEKYTCIIEKCEKELKEQLQEDINSQKEYIEYLEDPKQHSNKKTHVKEREASIKKARKELERLQKLLSATKIDPKDVANQLRLL